jgi:hypothetical protein
VSIRQVSGGRQTPATEIRTCREPQAWCLCTSRRGSVWADQEHYTTLAERFNNSFIHRSRGKQRYKACIAIVNEEPDSLNPMPYRSRFAQLKTVGPALLLSIAWGMVYFGVAPLWPLREDAAWPMVPLVSLPPGSTPDVWSSVLGLLQVCIAAAQCILVVELARIVWTFPVRLALAALAYELVLFVDWFRAWAGDWYIWALYQLRLGELCTQSAPCYPTSGHKPWPSLVMLLLVCAVLFTADRRVRRIGDLKGSTP